MKFEDLKIHPVAALFPLLEGAEFGDLCVNIKDNGLLDPIVFDGDVLLDGRNRWRACKELGVEIRSKQWSDLNLAVTKEDWITSRNLHRRHLSDDQRTQIMAAILDWQFEQSAKDKQEQSRFSKEKPHPGPGRGKKTVTENSGQPFPRRDRKQDHARSTAGKLAKAANVSEHAAAKALRIRKATRNGELPKQVEEHVKQGKTTANEALAQLPLQAKRTRRDLQARVDSALRSLFKKFSSEELPEVKRLLAQMI